VIFCLMQKQNAVENQKVNPLQPYFLVYVRDDKIVRYTFTHPKQILEIFRLLCVGQTKPFEDLCRKFDTETQNGNDMQKYTELMKSAVKSIAHTFQKRVTASLFDSRGATIPPISAVPDEETEFELITWLVIK